MPEYDVAVIGAGPGGYVAAIRAAQLGLSAVIIERESVGGLCLNWGCIPSKAMLHGADLITLFKQAPEFGIGHGELTFDLGVSVERSRQVVAQQVAGVETLLQQNGVRLVRGTATITGPNRIDVVPGGETVNARNIIVATGARTRSLPNLAIDGKQVITSREALDMRTVPSSIVIVGGGPIGVEFGYLYRSYGAEVTIVELMPHLLPNEDEDVSRELEGAFRRQGITLKLGTRVDEVIMREDGVRLRVSAGEATQELMAEVVLIGVGFEANSAALGLDRIGVELENGWVKVDEYCQTNLPGVWAVGDMTGLMLLAHVASRQGVVAVEKIAGMNPPPLDYNQMPRAVYCQPQVAGLGLSESQARGQGLDVRTSRFPFHVNGKAMAIGQTEGFVKLVVDNETGEVIGFHMVGCDATELLGEAILAKALETTSLEIGSAVHAHPTLSEAVKEAALAVSGESIHFYSRRRS